MRRIVRSSAPGKIHLIGEHSSVYGKPAILAAIDKRVVVAIEKAPQKVKQNKTLLSIQKYLNKKFKIPIESFLVSTDGNLPIGRGMGSSAAYSSALAACLFDFYNLKFDLDEIYNAAYEGEKIIHGNPSGGDLAACVYGGIIYFRKESENVKLYKKINPKKNFSFFAIDSGKSVESTKEMVLRVSHLPKKRIEKFCCDQEILSKKMADEIMDGLDVSKTINMAEKNLETIRVVGAEAKNIIQNLNSKGFSAKISGGGGVKKGSGMIIVEGSNPKRITNLCNKNGWESFSINIEDEGVRLEK